MRHFDITEWTDYARGAILPPLRDEMDAHLSEDCSRCQRTATTLGKLAEAARTENRYEVPPHALSFARSLFPLQGPSSVQIFPGVDAELVFDSFRDWALAGVRSPQQISRQTLYRANDWSVSLRMDHDRGSSLVSLVGQITSQRRPFHNFEGVPVLLTSGRDVLAQAISNRFGEFRMEFAPRNPLRLHVDVKNEGIEFPVSSRE